jgi:hypothetical protein
MFITKFRFANANVNLPRRKYATTRTRQPLRYVADMDRPTLTLGYSKRYFGIGDGNDFVVLRGGRYIGRIMVQPQAPDGRP